MYAALDINRVNPPDPDIVGPDDEWVDYQDLDLKICCDANLVEDSKASDNGTVEKGGDGAWAIQMTLDLLPTEGSWDLYAYVRATGASGTAFSMGVYPGGTLDVSASEVQDGEYHVFEFPGGPFSFETGRYLWFSRETGTMYVDRVVAVKTGMAKNISNENIENENEAKDANLPKKFALHDNYPNPFNPATTIRYDLPREAHVKITVFDITGAEVVTLIDRSEPAGYHDITFTVSNLASGIYFYQMKAGDFSTVKRMVLLK